MVTSDENTYGDRNTLDSGQFSLKNTKNSGTNMLPVFGKNM